MKKMRTAKRALVMLCAAAITSFALAGTAFAATVHGTDFHGTGSALESGEIDVLDVDGSAGEVVFLAVSAGDAVIAKNLPYTLGENAAEGDGATWTGVASLDLKGIGLDALDGTYTVKAYSNRAGDDLLYSGAIYGVFADLPDGTTKLIGTRTADEAELVVRAFAAPETLFADGKTYRLAGEASNDGGILHFAYEEYDEATTLDGVIRYTDMLGQTIASTKIPGLAYGEERMVDVPSVIVADDGGMYRTVYFTNKLKAVNPGQTSFSIYCSKMTDADQALAGYYVATINMVDQDGNVIATDSVDVTGEFIYTAPGTIYKTQQVDEDGNVVDEGGTTAVVTYAIDGSPVIRLSAANDGVQNHERTITVPYTAQSLDDFTVTFNFIDGSKRINDPARIFDTKSIDSSFKPDGITVADVLEGGGQVTVDGVAYNLVGDVSDYAYVKGEVPIIDVYFVPEGYEAPGPYGVTVNYVNFLTGEAIESHSYTSDAGANARIEIETPEAFSADGVDYVRLAGQEAPIQHSYYSGIASYTVYYRDVNDELTSGTVINTIRVVYADGTVEGGDAAAGGAAGGGADAAAADAAGAIALQLNAGRTYNVFDGADNNGSLTNESGVNSNTERIEDSETPLASGFDRGGASTAASSLTSTMVPIGIGIAVIAAILVAVVAVRRRKDDEATEMYEL